MFAVPSGRSMGELGMPELLETINVSTVNVVLDEPQGGREEEAGRREGGSIRFPIMDVPL